MLISPFFFPFYQKAVKLATKKMAELGSAKLH